MRSLKTEGIIIKRNNVGEADRIITIFTKHYGKLTAKATGVRKITSRRSSHIELLNLSEMHLHKGLGMPVLTEIITIENFSEMKNDLQTIGFAYHICELMDGLCAENQENTKIYFLLKNTLKRLSQLAGSSSINKLYLSSQSSSTKREDAEGGKTSIVEIVHEFEVELLTLLGFWYVPPQIPYKRVNTHSIIENLLERKLKSKQLLSHFGK